MAINTFLYGRGRRAVSALSSFWHAVAVLFYIIIFLPRTISLTVSACVLNNVILYIIEHFCYLRIPHTNSALVFPFR